jgi:hypothetical protein
MSRELNKDRTPADEQEEKMLSKMHDENANSYVARFQISVFDVMINFI